jgi:hypothetical protein
VPHPGLSDPRAPLPAPPKKGIETQGPNMYHSATKPKPKPKAKKKKAPGKVQKLTPGGSSFGPGPAGVPS